MFILVLINLHLTKKGADKVIKLWDVYTGQIMRTMEGHVEGISDIAWSNDGAYLASASDDKTIRIWDTELVSSVLLSSLFDSNVFGIRALRRKFCWVTQTSCSV